MLLCSAEARVVVVKFLLWFLQRFFICGLRLGSRYFSVRWPYWCPDGIGIAGESSRGSFLSRTRTAACFSQHDVGDSAAGTGLWASALPEVDPGRRRGCRCEDGSHSSWACSASTRNPKLEILTTGLRDYRRPCVSQDVFK